MNDHHLQWIIQVRFANPARGQLEQGNRFYLASFAPRNFAWRDPSRPPTRVYWLGDNISILEQPTNSANNANNAKGKIEDLLGSSSAIELLYYTVLL